MRKNGGRGRTCGKLSTALRSVSLSPGRTSEATLSPCTLTMLLPVRSSAACGFVSGAGSAGCDSPFPIGDGERGGARGRGRGGTRGRSRLPGAGAGAGEVSGELCAAALDADQSHLHHRTWPPGSSARARNRTSS